MYYCGRVLTRNPAHLMIIVSITGPRMSDALRQMKSSRRFAGMFELRLDMIRKPDIVALLSAAGKPVIVSCRTKSHGGAFSGSPNERVMLLRLAAALGADFVDLEYPKDLSLEGWGEAKRGPEIILSCHMKTPPADPAALFLKMHRSGSAVLKLAYGCTDAGEIRAAVDFLHQAFRRKQRAMAIAMGESGEASRVLYGKMGGWGTFASPEEGPEAAPGQIPAGELVRTYRAETLNRNTSVFGVIGYPLTQSRGPWLHNPLFQSAGKDAVYCRFPVRNLGRFLKTMGPMLQGFSVTLPHKESMIRYLDNVDVSAKRIGAVNTVLRRTNGWWGTNTDAPGALDAIESQTKVRGKRILVLGAGGAARAVVSEGLARGASVIIANRTARRARDLARAFGIDSVPWAVAATQEFDILVNATPLGMVPHTGTSPFAGGPSLAGKTVFDVVYNPAVTKFMNESEKAGATVIGGTAMYLNQAARQSELYCGRKPSKARMKRLLGHAR